MQYSGPEGLVSEFLVNTLEYPLLAPPGTYRVTLQMLPSCYLPQFAHLQKSGDALRSLD